MNDLSRRLVIAAVGSAAIAPPVGAQASDAPVKVMDRYAAALHAKNVDAIVDLFVENGVYIRPDFAPVIGQAALRAAYKEVFETLTVTLAFDIHEVEISGDIAWLRSSSAGTVKVIKTGAETKDHYNQVVVFNRERGAWKIRTYLYAPAPGPKA
jgi:uncharacterized protein (TIGR02246 family)